jgi:hypothetical protein
MAEMGVGFKTTWYRLVIFKEAANGDIPQSHVPLFRSIINGGKLGESIRNANIIMMSLLGSAGL